MPLRFEAAKALDVKLGDGERWVKPSDFTGAHAVIGRIRARYGASVSTFDADGDGRLDLFLTSAVVGPEGIHDVLLLNKNDGRFEDATAAFGLRPDRASIGAAAADFDADRHIDILLTGAGANVLVRNVEGKKFEDITSTTLKPSGPPTLSLMARWIDLEQDGDLDLYIVNYCAFSDADKAFLENGETPPGLANSIYRNDGRPDRGSGATEQAFTPVATAYGKPLVNKGLSLALTAWPNAQALQGGNRAHTGIAVLDIDNDRDLDLVLSADKSPPVAILNDRLGRFHEVPIQGASTPDHGAGVLACDFDVDGRTDLVTVSPTARARLAQHHRAHDGRDDQAHV